MGSRKHRRTAWATGLSVVLHILALTGMVIGLKVVGPPPECRAMEVRLVPAPKSQPRPEPAQRSPERPNAATPLRPHLTPLPSSQAPAVTLPEAPTPTPAPQAEAGPKGLLPSLSGRLGCDDPLTFHLTPEQRQACDNRLAKLAREARPLAPNIPDEKQAQYDTHVRCRDTYRKSFSMDIPKGCLGFGK
jgi:hypothetical protein